MKLMSLMAVVVFTMGTFAAYADQFSRRMPRPPVNPDRAKQRLLNKAGKTPAIIANNVEFMTHPEVRECLQLLRQVERIATGQGGGGTIDPDPLPSVVVNANVGGQRFVFETMGLGLTEILKNCEEQLRPTSPSRTDQVSVSVKGTRRQVTVPGWLNNVPQMCRHVASLAISAGYAAGWELVPNQKYVLYGRAQNNAILASGNSIRELRQSCLERVKVSSRMDSLTVAVNGQSPVRTSTGGWWHNSYDVCQAALSAVL